jgi:hypothetical protein
MIFNAASVRVGLVGRLPPMRPPETSDTAEDTANSWGLPNNVSIYKAKK